MRVILLAPAFLVTSTSLAFAEDHWWVLARGTDFKTYDKCVSGDGLASPKKVYESEEKLGWSPQLTDKGGEVAIEVILNGKPFAFRWFRTQDACRAAAQANDLGAGEPSH